MPRRVLIVDDNEIMREVLAIRLELEADFQLCGVAENGADAVSVAGQLQPDVVILDLKLPVCTGLDALPMIARAAPRAVVFLYSSIDEPSDISLARSRGAAGYFVKGVDDVGELLAAVRTRTAA